VEMYIFFLNSFKVIQNLLFGQSVPVMDGLELHWPSKSCTFAGDSWNEWEFSRTRGEFVED